MGGPTRSEEVYHDLSNLLRVVPVQVEPEGHHLPVVSLQLTLGHSVSSAGNLRAGWVGGGRVSVSQGGSLAKRKRRESLRLCSYAEDVELGLGDLLVA